jgi:VWFA-related protein
MACLRGLLFGLVLVSASLVYGQAPAPVNPQTSASPQAVFRATARAVLVDVVVTDKNSQPVTGLPEANFEILEDGQAQTVGSFDEHSGLPDLPALTRQASLPVNVFSNQPLVKTGDSANVLLLDSLNTALPDQSYVRSQMLKYIKEIQPGTRMAIFTLGSRLRFVQGFTTDASVLAAALNGKKTAGNQEKSPLLQTGADRDVNQLMVEQIQSTPGAQASAAALQSFLREQTGFQDDVRARITLQAFEQLAQYLAGIPGRKNVIWFSSSFPISLTEGVTETNLAYTANLLAAAQVAIYPLGAEGVAADRHFDFDNQQPPKIGPGQTVEQVHIQYQTDDLRNGQLERNRTHEFMDKLAHDTGGEALYNVNGLNESLAHVIKDGTHYYTLTYSPSNRTMDGRLRHIEVKVKGGNYRLAYRRGYYATNAFLNPGERPITSGDPLRPLMDHGTPDATGILYTMHIAPEQSQPASQAPRAGDNPDLKGPTTRYGVTFRVFADHLTLVPDAGGVRRGSLELTLVGYDRDGKALNWMVREFQMAVPPDRYVEVQNLGFPVKMIIDLPAPDIYLRSGVYDGGTNKAGTLEVPLTAIVAQSK